MTDVGELHSQMQVVHDDPATDEAAIRAVHKRWKTGQLTADQAVEALEMLGLVSYASGGRYDPNGRRYRRGAESVQKLSTLARVRADAQNPPTRAHSASNGHQGDDGGDA